MAVIYGHFSQITSYFNCVAELLSVNWTATTNKNGVDWWPVRGNQDISSVGCSTSASGRVYFLKSRYNRSAVIDFWLGKIGWFCDIKIIFLIKKNEYVMKFIVLDLFDFIIVLSIDLYWLLKFNKT